MNFVRLIFGDHTSSLWTFIFFMAASVRSTTSATIAATMASTNGATISAIVATTTTTASIAATDTAGITTSTTVHHRSTSSFVFTVSMGILPYTPSSLLTLSSLKVVAWQVCLFCSSRNCLISLSSVRRLFFSFNNVSFAFNSFTDSFLRFEIWPRSVFNSDINFLFLIVCDCSLLFLSPRF